MNATLTATIPASTMIDWENNTLCTGDRIKLTTGKIVKVNSIDRNRRVFDYIGDDGETYEVCEN